MEFRKALEDLINRHSRENGSNTPDFLLAEYLAACLDAFEKAVNERDQWYGRTIGAKDEVEQAFDECEKSDDEAA